MYVLFFKYRQNANIRLTHSVTRFPIPVVWFTVKFKLKTESYDSTCVPF